MRWTTRFLRGGVWVTPAEVYPDMTSRADLHIHSTASDGALTPTQLAAAAAELHLAAIALTDHDTVDGINEAVAAAKGTGVEVVPAVEISTVHETGAEVHVLGYFLNHSHQELTECLGVLASARYERGRKMVELLNQVGVQVSFERVVEIAGGGAIGRPHVARAIQEVGAASSMNSAFGKFLQEGGPGFVPRYKISPSRAVTLIRNAGGVACCAHVAKLKHDEILVELISQGLQGIEAYHPDHTRAGARFYERFARKHNLIATGGSDAHCIGGDKPGVGGVTVPYDVVDELRSASGSCHS